MNEYADLIFYAVLWLLLIMVVARRIKIVGEYERLAIFQLGHFYKLKGPGLVIQVRNVQTSVKVAIGDRGEMTGPEQANFSENILPAENEGSVRLGDRVRITGFSEDKVMVARDPNQSLQQKCPKCGHEFESHGS